MSRTFGGIEQRFAARETAAVILQGIPYDGTSTWGKGADRGFEAFLEAAEHLELYDIETDSDVFRRGIHMPPPLEVAGEPEAMVAAVRERAAALLESGRFLTFFGGEHSISIGIIRAFHDRHPALSVLQLDAHADLRREYLGSSCNHACALHEASRSTNLVQVGIRSMDRCEKGVNPPHKCFLASRIRAEPETWMEESLALLTDPVYLTIDLDVLDPAIMPATGTPEPGGLDWYTLLTYMRRLFASREVVGFDLVELAPIPGLRAPQFLAAKLYYKLLSYRFDGHA